MVRFVSRHLAMSRSLLSMMLLSLLFVTSILFPMSAQAAERQRALTTLIVDNQSSATICYLYITPSTSLRQGRDQLGDEVITPGLAYRFSLKAGTYHLQAQDCEHNTLAVRLNLLISSSITWTILDPQVTLNVRNESRTAICYLFISPSILGAWGTDRLGDEVIRPGEEYQFTLTPDTYDLRALDCERNVLVEEYGVVIVDNVIWTVRSTGAQSLEQSRINDQG